MKYYNNLKAQAGMTLIELTVVLLVLIGLAGLLIPYVAGFVGKTHDSTGTFNSAALDTNVQRYVAEKTSLPNNLESLVQTVAGTGAAGENCDPAGNGAIDNIYCKMMNTAFFTPVAAAAPRNMSLSMAGITDLYGMDPSTDNATFASTVALPTPIAPTTVLATVAAIDDNGDGTATVAEHMAAAFERPIANFNDTCYDYVAFGIGDKTDLIGSTMSTAPVHFAQQGTMGPVNRYNRFVAVVQVDKDNTTAGCSGSTEPAKFIGAAMAMGAGAGHLWGTSHSLAHTWENIAAN